VFVFGPSTHAETLGKSKTIDLSLQRRMANAGEGGGGWHGGGGGINEERDTEGRILTGKACE